VIALSTVGITIKLSFAFLGVFAMAAAAIGWLRQRTRDSGTGWRASLRSGLGPLGIASALAGAVLLIWVARGVVMTGHFAYPSNTSLGLDVDWRLPEQQVKTESRIIKTWARYPYPLGLTQDEVLHGWAWTGPWLANAVERADVFSVPILLLLAGLVPFAIRARTADFDRPSAALVLAPALIASVLWFLTAPAARFAGAIFWLLGAGIWALWHDAGATGRARRHSVQAAQGFVAVTLVAAVIAGALLSRDRYGWALFVTPGPESGFHPIPTAIVEKHVSARGVTHYVPVAMGTPSSKWTPELRCWDAPLPCTSLPRPDLAWRDQSQRTAGFQRITPNVAMQGPSEPATTARPSRGSPTIADAQLFRLAPTLLK
jgi:hypothetical protein